MFLFPVLLPVSSGAHSFKITYPRILISGSGQEEHSLRCGVPRILLQAKHYNTFQIKARKELLTLLGHRVDKCPFFWYWELLLYYQLIFLMTPQLCKTFNLELSILSLYGLPWWLSGKESACQCRRHGFDPWVRKIPWRRKWQPTPVF